MKEMTKTKRNRRNNLLNIIHAALLIVLIIYTLHGIYLGAGISTGNFFTDIIEGISTTGLNEIFTFIGAIAFVLFGIVGIYEFSYSNGLWFLFPPVYGNLREHRNEKTAEIMMRTYFESDRKFLQTVELERFKDILRVMKLTEEQFDQVNYDLLRVRSMHYKNKRELLEAARKIVLNKNYIVDLTQLPIKERVYHDVNYFINLYTVVYNEEVRTQIAKIMTSFIFQEIKNEISNIDYIVVPENGNLLLGLSVGEMLSKPVLSIQPKARIQQNQSWDGNYHYEKNHKRKIIIVHDILVTGNKIIDISNKLPKGSFVVLYLFCLVKYDQAQYDPVERIVNGISIRPDQIKCLLTTSERDLKLIIK